MQAAVAPPIVVSCGVPSRGFIVVKGRSPKKRQAAPVRAARPSEDDDDDSGGSDLDEHLLPRELFGGHEQRSSESDPADELPPPRLFAPSQPSARPSCPPSTTPSHPANTTPPVNVDPLQVQFAWLESELKGRRGPPPPRIAASPQMWSDSTATLHSSVARWMRAPVPPAPPAAWQPRLPRKASSWPRRPAGEPTEDETSGMVRQLEVQVEALRAEARKLRLARDAAVNLASSSLASSSARGSIPPPSPSHADGACRALPPSAATAAAAPAAAPVPPASSSLEVAACVMTPGAPADGGADSGAGTSPTQQSTPAGCVMRCHGTPSTSSPMADSGTPGGAEESGDEAVRSSAEEERATAKEQARWARARRSEAEKTRRDADRASRRQSEEDAKAAAPEAAGADASKARHAAEGTGKVPVTRAAREDAEAEDAEAEDAATPSAQAITWWQQGLEQVRERRELQAEVDRLREQVRQMSKQLEQGRAAGQVDVERELDAPSATAAAATTTPFAASSPQSGSQSSPPSPPPRTASALQQMLGLGQERSPSPARSGSLGGLLEATLEATWANLIASYTPRSAAAATTTVITSTPTATVVAAATATHADDDAAAASDDDDGDSDIDDELNEALSILSPPMRTVEQQEPPRPSPPSRSVLMVSPVQQPPPPPPPPRLQRRYVIMTTIVVGGRVRCALQVWQSAQRSSMALVQAQPPPTPPRRRPSGASGLPGTVPGLAGGNAAPALPAVLHVTAAIASPLTSGRVSPRVVSATHVEKSHC